MIRSGCIHFINWCKIFFFREVIRHSRSSSISSDRFKNFFRNWWYATALIFSVMIMVAGTWGGLSYSEMVRKKYKEEQGKAINWVLRIKGVRGHEKELNKIFAYHNNYVKNFYSKNDLLFLQKDNDVSLSVRTLNWGEPILDEFRLKYPEIKNNKKAKAYLKWVIENGIGVIVSVDRLNKFIETDKGYQGVKLIEIGYPNECSLPVLATVEHTHDDEDVYLGQRAYSIYLENYFKYDVYNIILPKVFENRKDEISGKLKETTGIYPKFHPGENEIKFILNPENADTGYMSKMLGPIVQELTKITLLPDKIKIDPVYEHEKEARKSSADESWIYFLGQGRSLETVNKVLKELERIKELRIDKGPIWKMENQKIQAELTRKFTVIFKNFTLIFSAMLLVLVVYMDTFKKLHATAINRAFGGSVWLESIIPLSIWFLIFYLIFGASLLIINNCWFHYPIETVISKEGKFLLIQQLIIFGTPLLLRWYMFSRSSIWDLLHHFE